MSNIDDDEILELEISDDETFGLHDGVGTPGKKRRVTEETVPEVVYSAERTVTLLPNSTVPITLPTTSVPEQTLQKSSVGFIPWEDTEIPWDVSRLLSVPKRLLFTQYIQSSFSSASRVNIYRSRIQLVYPELAASETRFIRFVPSEDGSDKEDNDAETYYDSGIHSLVEENPYGRSAKPWPSKRVLGPTPVQSFVDIAWNDRLGREFAENNLTSYEPKQMVHLSRSDALKLIAKTGPFYYDAKSSGDLNVCQI
jgi:hypothetical protein